MNTYIKRVLDNPALWVLVLAFLLGAGRASAQTDLPAFECPPGTIPDVNLLSPAYRGRCAHCLEVQPTATATNIVLGTQAPTLTRTPTLRPSNTPTTRPTSTPYPFSGDEVYVGDGYRVYTFNDLLLTMNNAVATQGNNHYDAPIIGLLWGFENQPGSRIGSQPAYFGNEDLWAQNPPFDIYGAGCANADPFGNGQYDYICQQLVNELPGLDVVTWPDILEFQEYISENVLSLPVDISHSGLADMILPGQEYETNFGYTRDESWDWGGAPTPTVLGDIPGKFWIIVSTDDDLPSPTPSITPTASVTPTITNTPFPSVHLGAEQTCTVTGGSGNNPIFCSFSPPGSASQQIVGYRIQTTYTRNSHSPSVNTHSCSTDGPGFIKLNPNDSNCNNFASTQFSGASGMTNQCIRVNGNTVLTTHASCTDLFPAETFTQSTILNIYPAATTWLASYTISVRAKSYNSCGVDCFTMAYEFVPILYGIPDATPTGTPVGTASPTPTLTVTPSPTFTRTLTRTPNMSLTPSPTSQYPEWYDADSCLEWEYSVTQTVTASPSPSNTPTPTMTVTPDITQTSAWVTGTSSTDGTATDIAATQWMAATSTIISETSTAGFQQTETSAAIMGTAVAGTTTQEAITSTPGIQQTQTYEYVGTAFSSTLDAQATAAAGSFTGTPNPDYWGTGTDELVSDADGVGTGRGGFVGIDARGVSVWDGSCFIILPKISRFKMEEPTSVCVKWVNFPTMNIFGLLLPLDIIVVLPFFSLVRRLWTVPTS